ncbi:N(6)-adenine-specific methyltransferase METTL4 [Puntigrus tetrazona]|uniref:N(6)-adenine-specific methyltransferase METTL4 n=1 Tax=Puntigrus tetrazona TaxID=1606681 RepID=UPI001C895657|nr:N(6)-adenine-specific methyltransferase METTL4 [Puntigrus tetrazona]
MSVVCADPCGWLLDPCSLTDEGLRRCVSLDEGPDAPRVFRCRFRREYFNTSRPHLHQSTADLTSAAKHSDARREEIDLQTRKKRKRKQRDLNTGEADARVYHGKIRSAVLEGSRALLEAGRRCGHLTGARVEPPPRSEAWDECRLAALCDVAKRLPLADESVEAPVNTLSRDALDPAADLFSRLTENPSDCACEVTLMKEKYLLPPRSRFLLSDITRMHPLLNCGDRFDLIVLDPPWENKSVKRSSRYSSLPSSQIKRLPVPALAAPGCLVVTWVTNRAKHLRFVREELYPFWEVDVLAEWLWVKVTRAGEFVFPLDSPHKKPYEVLVLGRRRPVRSSEAERLPEQRLVISVPSVLHSHKPSLSAVLKPYVSPEPKCLELFARSLQSDWTSWGNQAIKFQHSSYFSRESAEETPVRPRRPGPPARCSSTPSVCISKRWRVSAR